MCHEKSSLFSWQLGGQNAFSWVIMNDNMISYYSMIIFLWAAVVFGVYSVTEF